MTLLTYGQMPQMKVYGARDFMSRSPADFKKHLGIAFDPQEIFARTTGKIWEDVAMSDSDEDLDVVVQVLDILTDIFTIDEADGIDDVNLTDSYIITRYVIPDSVVPFIGRR